MQEEEEEGMYYNEEQEYEEGYEEYEEGEEGEEEGEAVYERITMKRAQQLGFKFLDVPLYSSRLKFNTARVEAGLQASLQAKHPLGNRLWRHPGLGAKADEGLVKDVMYYVNITHITLAGENAKIVCEDHISTKTGKVTRRIKSIFLDDGTELMVIH